MLEDRGGLFLSQKEQQCLSCIFSVSNIARISRRSATLVIQGKEEAVFYHGHKTPVIELPGCLPGKVMKWDPFRSQNSSDAIVDRYETMVRARKICQDDSLDHLIVPQCALVHFPDVSFAVCVEKKYALKDKEKSFGLYQGPGLELIVQQLTRLICRLEGRFTDLKWENIPLVEDDADLRVVLVDLEHAPKHFHGIKFALCGWLAENSQGHVTPGLIRCLPHYATTIYTTIRDCLSASEFSVMHTDLEDVINKARAISSRQIEIEQHYQQHSITYITPAIPMAIFDDWKPSLGANKEALRPLIEHVNRSMAKQMEAEPYLVYAREWSLTQHPDAELWQKQIYENRTLLQQDLLPFLQKQHVVHAVLSAEEAATWDIHLRRRFHSSQDLFVQF